MSDVYRIVRWEDIDRYPKPQYAVTDLHDHNSAIGALLPLDIEAGALALCIYRDPEADDHSHTEPCRASVVWFEGALSAAGGDQ